MSLAIPPMESTIPEKFPREDGYKRLGCCTLTHHAKGEKASSFRTTPKEHRD